MAKPFPQSTTAVTSLERTMVRKGVRGKGEFRETLEINESSSFPSVCKNKQLTYFLPMNTLSDKKSPNRKSFARREHLGY